MDVPDIGRFWSATTAPLLISHGGDTASGAVSGTWTAYRRAHELGFRAFQVDVVPAADGALLSMHAVFGRTPRLESGTLEAVRARLDDVPTLSELIAAYPDARWNIELKSARCEQRLVELIELHPARHLLCISAPFHTRVLRRLRRRFPDLSTNASLLEGALIGVALQPWRTCSADGVQVFSKLASGRVVNHHVRRGRAVQVWTVNDGAEASRLVDRGVVALIVDDYLAVAGAVAQRTI
ncbi:MAG: glycerophosphodiester phosphodiesterase [Ilumatobacter sp.]|jgi:glycerophosphoryl diester phosphodiesterase|uniref:glycerophosphodiester phosphodiesterase n=1 Tax=Ilumatobacter sp. TaxID=1967498 RepID=UPI00391BA356